MISLRFLGTGGARWVVAKQIRSSGGFWLQADGTNVHVDPGPGALVRALTQLPPCDPATLESNVPGIYLAGVIVAGMHTNEIFIENGRFHGKQIADAIADSLAPTQLISSTS